MIVPADNRPVEQGHTLDGTFVGLTRFDDGIGRRMVVLKENHWQVFCRNGGGKFITDAALQVVLHDGSAIVITPKSQEYVNFALGRRTDLTLWDRMSVSNGRLGIRPEGSQARFHLRNGRCFHFTAANHSHYPAISRHTLLSDVFAGGDDRAWSRLVAICGSPFPGDPKSSRDPWFYKSPTGALACACGHLLTAHPNRSHHALPYSLKWLMGIDPATGIANAKIRDKHFKEMMANPALNNRIQLGGSALLSLGERAFGTLNSELESNAGFLLDARYQHTLTGPSDMTYEDVGIDDQPITVFVSPVQGETEGDAFLRMHFRLSTLIGQQRLWTPSKPVRIFADECSSWAGSLSEECLRLLAIGRAKNLSWTGYWQDYNQMRSAWGEEGAKSAIANSALQMFGCNDPATIDLVAEMLGHTTIRSRVRGQSEQREVELASYDAIARDLRMTSPLKYVFSPARAPILLTRAAYKAIVTKEGGRFEGLPGLDGHYDEFTS